MTARSALAWRQVYTFAWLAPALEGLTLAALIVTILLLSYWQPFQFDEFLKSWEIGKQHQLVTLVNSWFVKSWDIGKQYDLVALFNSQFQGIMIYPVDIAAAITIVLGAAARVAASITRQEHEPLHVGLLYVTLPLIGLAGVAALSTRQAILGILSLEIALHLLLVAALVVVIINLRPPLWAIVAPLALLLVFEGTLSVLQTQMQSTLLGYLPFEWGQNTLATQAEASIVQLPNGTRWLRAYGTFPHPNILGGFLCLAIPLVAGAYLRLPRRSASAWLLLVSLVAGMPGLFLSFSRAAWLGLLMGALWAGLLLWQKRRAARSADAVPTANTTPPSAGNARLWLRPALLAVFGVGLLVGLVAALGPIVQSRLLLNSVPLEQRSLNERVVLLEAGALFFTEHPWLGVGAGNMPLIELAYPPTRNIGEPAHNVPVTIAVETGLFGALLWLVAPLGALWMAWRRRFILSAAGLAASSALVALLVVAQLDHYFWSQSIGSIIWWLAVTLAALWSSHPCFAEVSMLQRAAIQEAPPIPIT
jgi:O-antigen ligase